MERQLRLDFAGELEADIPLEKVIGLGIEQVVAATRSANRSSSCAALAGEGTGPYGCSRLRHCSWGEPRRLPWA